MQNLVVNNAINLIVAILILAIGWTVAGAASKWSGQGLRKIPHFDATLRPLLASLIRYGILAITVIMVLQRFGVETTSLIAILGAAGLAIGLAMQGTLSNVAAGVMLLVLRPFRVGDAIASGAISGTVREIGLFTTILITADMLYVSVPNSLIFAGAITNYSREPTRRINFTIGIDYNDDIDKAQEAVLAIMNDDPRILKQPVPTVPVEQLADSSVNLTVRCWVPTADYQQVLWGLQKKVKQRLDAEGITIPYPQHVVSIRDGKPADAATAAAASAVIAAPKKT